MPGCIQTLGRRRVQGLDQTDWQTLQGSWQPLWISSYDFSTWCKTSAALRLTLLKKEMTSTARSAFCYICRRWEYAAAPSLYNILQPFYPCAWVPQPENVSYTHGVWQRKTLRCFQPKPKDCLKKRLQHSSRSPAHWLNCFPMEHSPEEPPMAWSSRQ